MNDVVLTHPQFALLQAVAVQRRSASELATAVDTSLPYVLSQLKLLEAQNLVKKQAVKSGKPGKPKQYYTIAKELISVLQISPGFAKRFTLDDHDLMSTYMQLVGQLPQYLHAAFSAYFWSHAHMMRLVDIFALIAHDKGHVELLAIAQEDNLEILRKEAASYKFKGDGKLVKVACWMHSKKEIEDGLAKKDDYYVRLRSQLKTMRDPQRYLETIQ